MWAKIDQYQGLKGDIRMYEQFVSYVHTAFTLISTLMCGGEGSPDKLNTKTHILENLLPFCFFYYLSPSLYLSIYLKIHGRF